MRSIGIITARGGSKGVPRKNIRTVAGKPLIAHTILAAQSSKLLTTFLTSTDDDEIAQIARAWGSDVIMRPPELAADDSPTEPSIQHVIRQLSAKGQDFDYAVVLQPTSPQRTAEDIDAALTILDDSGVDTVISVYQVEDHHPSRMYRIDDGYLVPYDTETPDRQRRNLTPVYHRNGAVYAFKVSLVMEEGTLIGPSVRPYLMDRARSINIDDELDLILADLLMSRAVESSN